MLDDTKAFDRSTELLAGAPATGNRLLDSLPPEGAAFLLAQRRTETVMPGQILLQPGDAAPDAFFPTGGTVLTVLTLMPDRKPVETAQIGCEGAAGALLGPQPGAFGFRIAVLTAGSVLRIPAERLGEALATFPSLRERMTRYTMALLAQLQIGTACAALHPVEERACRWILTLQDRLGERALPLTQEALADLLGVRRTTITRVVAALEARGLVRHRRGRIIVMDRAGLEQASCACHGLVRERFEAIAPGLYPRGPADEG